MSDGDLCIHELVCDQARRTPDNVAIEFEATRLSYAELERKANQLASCLRRLGAYPDTRVGICLHRSVEMVVSLLGIFKSGAACLPLDPTYPLERLHFMVRDAGLSILITSTDLSFSTSLQAPRVVLLDPDMHNVSNESDIELQDLAVPDNLAYVIYTSGSTGTPKPIGMTHRPLVNLIRWMMASSGTLAEGRTLQFSPLNFDVSFQEVFSTWCSGGTLVLISEQSRRDLAKLPRLLSQKRIQRCFLPTVALQEFAASLIATDDEPAWRLRQIITSGEQLIITSDIVDAFRRLNDCYLENQYGPSETHVVTSFRMPGDRNVWCTQPPIGLSIRNAEIYLTDQDLNPVSPGAVGELQIAGECVGRGYLNRPSLTAENFVPNPFTSKPGARMYRSGDLARSQGDGNIVFVGRSDDQVKIRGYRVELAEIEAILGQHRSVRHVAVVASELKAGGRRLIAFIVPAEIPPLVGDLRTFLRSKLPEYMVPALFVLLSAIPVTPSGKVDRIRLQEEGFIRLTE